MGTVVPCDNSRRLDMGCALGIADGCDERRSYNKQHAAPSGRALPGLFSHCFPSKMEDADLIAYVYLHQDFQGVGAKAIHASWLRAPHLCLPQSPEPTGSPEACGPGPGPGPDTIHVPRLDLRFSDIPRTGHGIVFGSNRTCDVVLRHPQISRCHFSLTFDRMNRPIVRDWGSRAGTEVTYDRDGPGVRRNFEWIVGGHEVPQERHPIIITIPAIVSFEICVARHDITSQAYIDRVKSFRQGTATTEDLLDDLSLPPGDTKFLAGALKPGKGKISLTKPLGCGAFGAVSHVWNVSNGREFAKKEAINTRSVKKEAWEKEARLMGQISHIRARLPPSPPHPPLYACD